MICFEVREQEAVASTTSKNIFLDKEKKSVLYFNLIHSMENTMAITSTTEGDTITINISGRFDFSCHKEFREAYRNTPAGTANRFVINMSGTEYVDSSALGMLLLLREHAGSDESKVTLQGCRNDVKDILIVSNFDKLFTIS